MDVTGLQPAPDKVRCIGAGAVAGLPGRDHDSDWFEPKAGSYVCLDEPYGVPGLGSSERALWFERSGLSWIEPEWEGIYCPRGCAPCLISHDGELLQRLAGALKAVQNSKATSQSWNHATGDYNDDFVSPGRFADGKPRRRRPAIYRQPLVQ